MNLDPAAGRESAVGAIHPDELAGHDLFGSLSADARREILTWFGPRVAVADGTPLCREGEAADRWWVVMQGSADVTAEGFYVRSIGVGEIVADVALRDGGARSASVTAREQLVVAELAPAAFAEFLDGIPGFARALGSQLGARVRNAGTHERPAAPAAGADGGAALPSLPDDLLSVLIDPAFYQDPHPYYAALRETSPTLWDPALELWVVSRFDDVRFVLRDRRFTSDAAWANPTGLLAAKAELDAELGATHLLTHHDGDGHQRLRRLFAEALTTRRVEAWRGEVRDFVTAILDEAEEVGRFDVVEDLAIPLPTRVISRLLGLPSADEDQLHRWSADLSELGSPVLDPDRRARVVAAGRSLVSYLMEAAVERRRRPGSDTLSALVTGAARHGVGDDELIANTTLLYAAGHMTTAALIGGGLATLAHSPSDWRRLNDDPDLVPNTIEELLRWEAPSAFFRRYATESVPLGDVTINAGDSVVVCLASANRDPRRFGSDANRLRIDRPGAHEHLSFAAGRHFCIGAGLARLEAQATIETIVRRWPELTPVDQTVQWRESFVARMPVALAVQTPHTAR